MPPRPTGLLGRPRGGSPCRLAGGRRLIACMISLQCIVNPHAPLTRTRAARLHKARPWQRGNRSNARPRSTRERENIFVFQKNYMLPKCRNERTSHARWNIAILFIEPSTVRPLARDLRVMIGWLFRLGFGVLVWTGACYYTGTAWAGLCLIQHHHCHITHLFFYANVIQGGNPPLLCSFEWSWEMNDFFGAAS